MKISVVIPVYNEVDSIPRLYKELSDVLSNFDWYEIFFIDDGSSDGSDEVIKKIIETNSKINLIQFHRNYGKSAALSEGFKIATGNYILTMDADLQNDPADLPFLIESLEGYGAVCGIRPSRADSISKKISTKIANLFRNTILRDGIKDAGCTYRVFRKEVLVDIVPFRGMHRFLPTILQFHGIQVNQVLIKDRPRKSGVSKYGMGNRIFVGFVDTLAIYWYKKRFISPFKK